MSASISKKRRHKDKERHPRQVCKATGKLAYPSRKRGLTALNYLRSDAAQAGRTTKTVPVAIYRCQLCGNWHLTSKEQRT